MARSGSLSPRPRAACRVASIAALRASGFVDSAASIFTPVHLLRSPIFHIHEPIDRCGHYESMRLKPSGVGAKSHLDDQPVLVRLHRRSELFACERESPADPCGVVARSEPRVAIVEPKWNRLDLSDPPRCQCYNEQQSQVIAQSWVHRVVVDEVPEVIQDRWFHAVEELRGVTG